MINAGCGATSATGSNNTAHLVAINTAVATSMAGGDLFAHRIRGLAVHGTNIYFTLKDGSSAGIKAICRSSDSIGCTGGAGTYNSTVISGMTNALGPAGIAIDSAHNILFWSQTGDGTVHGYCPSNTCGTTHGPLPISNQNVTGTSTRIAGTGAVGYSGDGGSARSASLANPIQLILSRTHDGATSTSSTSLHDHNLIIVEGAKQTTGGTVTGNAIRILCGNSNNTGPTETFDPGFCQGRTPGTLHRIAGTPNRIGHAMNTGMPLSTSFANLTSATFDPYKNLVVSSSAGFAGLTSDGTNNQWFVDHALYTILNNATVGVSGAKYSFEDSAGKKSLYCLRVTAKQSCSWRFDGTDLIENCICSMEPGLPSGGQVFDGTTIDTSCP